MSAWVIEEAQSVWSLSEKESRHCLLEAETYRVPVIAAELESFL